MMKPLPLTFAATIGLLVLGGCTTDEGALSARLNPSLYSVHQPVVQRTDYALDLNAGSALAHGEAERLRAWFDGLGIGYGDTISIEAASETARAEIGEVVASYGLLLADGAPVTMGSPLPGTLRVVVSRARAAVPGCPDWNYSSRPGAPLSTDSNYGCATHSNLAAMIADPDDLVHGRTSHNVGDAAVGAKAIKVYRDRPQTGASGELRSTEIGSKE